MDRRTEEYRGRFRNDFRGEWGEASLNYFYRYFFHMDSFLCTTEFVIFQQGFLEHAGRFEANALYKQDTIDILLHKT